MAIHPIKTEVKDRPLDLDHMTPGQIVEELDKHVVGQEKAKRAVAVALRSRIRRRKLPPEVAEEIQPKNILMIGSTGVGKTEIARRLARLAGAPFLKVEASKFTEVGYVGRDVESIIRDLVDIALEMVRHEKATEIEDKAERTAEERLLDLLLPPLKETEPEETAEKVVKQPRPQQVEKFQKTREKLRRQLREGKLKTAM